MLRLALKAAVHWEMAIDHMSGWASRIGWLLLVVLPPLIFHTGIRTRIAACRFTRMCRLRSSIRFPGLRCFWETGRPGTTNSIGWSGWFRGT